MKRYSLNQIKNSFNPVADDVSLILRHIFRPPSFYLTHALLKLGIKPNQATLIGLFLGLAGVVFFIIGQRFSFCLGVFFYFLFLIFDFIDGNIARVTDSATYYGKFIDGAVDTIVETLLVYFITIGLYFTGYNRFFLLSGTFVAMLLLFASFLMNRASFFNRWLKMEKTDKQKGFSQSKDTQDVNPLKSNRLPLKKICNISTDVKILTLLIAAIIGMTQFLFIVFLMSVTVGALALVIVTMLNARRQLDVHRISKWDSRLKKCAAQ